MPLPSVRYDLNLGLVNAKAKNDLGSGQLTRAEGIYYKRGSDECWMKSGRTAFDSDSVGTPGIGLYYAEFSSATSQILARAGSNLYRADVGLTGTFTPLSQSLSPNALGLWGTFANEKYYFNDGVSDPQTLQYRFSDQTYILRQSGLNPPTEQPEVSINIGGSSTGATLTSSSVRSNGSKDFSNQGNFVDGDMDTWANVTINDGGNNSRIFAENFTGTDSGVRSDWILAITYETTTTANGRCTTAVSYSTDGGSSYNTASETTTDAQGKHTVVIPIPGSVDSANIGGRLVLTKVNDNGKATCNAFDARLYTSGGVGIVDNTITTGLIYWVTESIDYAGIESVAGPYSSSTGPFSNISSIQITLPTAPVNSTTTHYKVYRTTDGGAFPTGTLVGTYEITKTVATDPGPLNTVASTIVYGAFTVAGVVYHRDVIGPVSTVMATYQNAVVVAPVDFPNKIRYSAAGYPESFPTLNVINLASDRDDTVMGLAVLSSQLGVFMKGRGVRVDHLPTPSDPTFSIQPEPFSPDNAGLESRNGLAYLALPGNENHTHIGYVARDGIRITNLYQTNIVTTNINWNETVDVTRLSESYLRNHPSGSRLEFYFVPTDSFRETQGWTADVNACMWLHYSTFEGFDSNSFRITVQAANISSAVNVPFEGTDYMFLMSSGIRVEPGVVFVDEVGVTDDMQSVDSTGIVYRRIKTGQSYIDSVSRLMRYKVNRLAIDADPDVSSIVATLTAGRDDTGQSWSMTQTFTDVAGGVKPLWFNISGQWFDFLLTLDDTATVPAKVRNISYTIEELGEIV